LLLRAQPEALSAASLSGIQHYVLCIPLCLSQQPVCTQPFTT
jgi:hypothetical protein